MTRCEAPTPRAAPAALAALALAGSAALVLAACDIPTGLPRFESRFVVPLDGPRLAVTELLPPSVTASGAEFRLAVPPSAGQRALGEMCEPCRAAHLSVVPKPAFTYAFTVVGTLPAQVTAAVVTSGTVQVRVRHTFGFDPLRPAGRTQDGTLTLVARSAGRVLGSAVVDAPFPSGIELSRGIAVAAGAVDGPIEIVATITSPAGGPVAINADAVLRVDAAAGTLGISEARVTVANRQVSVAPTLVDLTRMDEELRGRVRRGALVIVLDNPFGIAGELELRMRVQQTGLDLRRAVQLAPGGTTQRIELTQQELQSLIGERVMVSVAGPVSGAAGPVTVRPGMELSIDPRLDLVLEFGS